MYWITVALRRATECFTMHEVIITIIIYYSYHEGIGYVAVLYITTLFTLDVTSGYWQCLSTIYYNIIYFICYIRVLAMWQYYILQRNFLEMLHQGIGNVALLYTKMLFT